MSTLLKIPTESFKKIEVPGGDKPERASAVNSTEEAGFYGKEKMGKMSVAVVNIKDLPKALDEWRVVNPREVNLNSGVSKQIRETLEKDPEQFVMRNRGITLVVDRAEFKNQLKELHLELGDKEVNGVLDGGHTLMNIRQYLEQTEEPSDAYVRIEILENIGDIDETVKIVDARNRSTEVKIASLENLLGHFNALKQVLDAQPYGEKIAYKENELAEDGDKKKEVPIEEVLSYILCFDTEDFDHKSHPIKAYSGKASVVKHFRGNVEKMQKYFSLAPDILALRDTIYEDLPLVWNAVGNDANGGRLGKIRGVKTLKEPKVLPFSNRSTRHLMPSGFIYPALAAFRPLVEVKDGKAFWKEKPSKIYGEVREELVKTIVDTAKRVGNPNEMGKDPNFWLACYSLVEREVFMRKI